jgi:hypothetical protein
MHDVRTPPDPDPYEFTLDHLRAASATLAWKQNLNLQVES